MNKHQPSTENIYGLRVASPEDSRAQQTRQPQPQYQQQQLHHQQQQQQQLLVPQPQMYNNNNNNGGTAQKQFGAHPQVIVTKSIPSISEAAEKDEFSAANLDEDYLASQKLFLQQHQHRQQITNNNSNTQNINNLQYTASNSNQTLPSVSATPTAAAAFRDNQPSAQNNPQAQQQYQQYQAQTFEDHLNVPAVIPNHHKPQQHSISSQSSTSFALPSSVASVNSLPATTEIISPKTSEPPKATRSNVDEIQKLIKASQDRIALTGNAFNLPSKTADKPKILQGTRQPAGGAHIPMEMKEYAINSHGAPSDSQQQSDSTFKPKLQPNGAAKSSAELLDRYIPMSQQILQQIARNTSGGSANAAAIARSAAATAAANSKSSQSEQTTTAPQGNPSQISQRNQSNNAPATSTSSAAAYSPQFVKQQPTEQMDQINSNVQQSSNQQQQLQQQQQQQVSHLQKKLSEGRFRVEMNNDSPDNMFVRMESFRRETDVQMDDDIWARQSNSSVSGLRKSPNAPIENEYMASPSYRNTFAGSAGITSESSAATTIANQHLGQAAPPVYSDQQLEYQHPAIINNYFPQDEHNSHSQQSQYQQLHQQQQTSITVEKKKNNIQRLPSSESTSGSGAPSSKINSKAWLRDQLEKSRQFLAQSAVETEKYNQAAAILAANTAAAVAGNAPPNPTGEYPSLALIRTIMEQKDFQSRKNLEAPRDSELTPSSQSSSQLINLRDKYASNTSNAAQNQQEERQFEMSPYKSAKGSPTTAAGEAMKSAVQKHSPIIPKLRTKPSQESLLRSLEQRKNLIFASNGQKCIILTKDTNTTNNNINHHNNIQEDASPLTQHSTSFSKAAAASVTTNVASHMNNQQYQRESFQQVQQQQGFYPDSDRITQADVQYIANEVGNGINQVAPIRNGVDEPLRESQVIQNEDEEAQTTQNYLRETSTFNPTFSWNESSDDFNYSKSQSQQQQQQQPLPSAAQINYHHATQSVPAALGVGNSNYTPAHLVTFGKTGGNPNQLQVQVANFKRSNSSNSQFSGPSSQNDLRSQENPSPNINQQQLSAVRTSKQNLQNKSNIYESTYAKIKRQSQEFNNDSSIQHMNPSLLNSPDKTILSTSQLLNQSKPYLNNSSTVNLLSPQSQKPTVPSIPRVTKSGGSASSYNNNNNKSAINGNNAGYAAGGIGTGVFSLHSNRSTGSMKSPKSSAGNVRESPSSSSSSSSSQTSNNAAGVMSTAKKTPAKNELHWLDYSSFERNTLWLKLKEEKRVEAIRNRDSKEIGKCSFQPSLIASRNSAGKSSMSASRLTLNKTDTSTLDQVNQSTLTKVTNVSGTTKSVLGSGFNETRKAMSTSKKNLGDSSYFFPSNSYIGQQQQQPKRQSTGYSVSSTTDSASKRNISNSYSQINMIKKCKSPTTNGAATASQNSQAAQEASISQQSISACYSSSPLQNYQSPTSQSTSFSTAFFNNAHSNKQMYKPNTMSLFQKNALTKQNLKKE